MSKRWNVTNNKKVYTIYEVENGFIVIAGSPERSSYAFPETYVAANTTVLGIIVSELFGANEGK